MNRSEIHILVADDDYSVLDRYRLIFGQVEGDDGGDDEDLLDEFIESLGGEWGSDGDEVGWNITLVEQGFDAVQQARQAHQQRDCFTHAFLDMRMPPGIDGLETAVRLRELDPEIRIIFVSAYHDYNPAEIDNQLGSGWIFLQKPFKEEEILRILENDGW